MYNVQKLLWDVRHDPSLAQRFQREPDPVLDGYGIVGEHRAAMGAMDLKALYDAGANPYLLYFCALQLGVPRQEYYERIRGER